MWCPCAARDAGSPARDAAVVSCVARSAARGRHRASLPLLLLQSLRRRRRGRRNGPADDDAQTTRQLDTGALNMCYRQVALAVALLSLSSAGMCVTPPRRCTFARIKCTLNTVECFISSRAVLDAVAQVSVCIYRTNSTRYIDTAPCSSSRPTASYSRGGGGDTRASRLY